MFVLAIHRGFYFGVGDNFQILKVLEGTGTFQGWGTTPRYFSPVTPDLPQHFDTLSPTDGPGKAFFAISCQQKCEWGGHTTSGKMNLPGFPYGISSSAFHTFDGDFCLEFETLFRLVSAWFSKKPLVGQ